MGAADGDLGLALVVHAELVTGLEPGDDFANVVEVDDEAAMSAPEEGGVEEVEELLEGAALGVAFKGLGDDADDAFVDGGEADVGLIDEEQAALGLDDEAGGLRGAAGAVGTAEQLEERAEVGLDLGFGERGGAVGEGSGEAAFDALDGLEDAGAVKGLEEVVNGVDVKGADGVLVIGRGEDDLGERVGFLAGGEAGLVAVEKALDDGETVEAGHLDVKKNQVGVVVVDEVDGFNAVGSVGEDFDAADFVEEEAELVAGQLFVVDDEGGERH